MAKYQQFDEYRLALADGQTFELMEWDSFDLKRGAEELKHVVPNLIQAGDVLNQGTVASITLIGKRNLTGYEEYSTNAKKGRLKEIRTTAKLVGFG